MLISNSLLLLIITIPDYIAGYIKNLLNKDLVPKGEPLLTAKGPLIGIKEYTIYNKQEVEGSFFISFIPAVDLQFNKCLSTLKGKNNQISHLRQILEQRGILDNNKRITFYDDSKSNVEQAKTMPNIDAYQVIAKAAQFTLINLKPILADQAPPQIAEQKRNAPPLARQPKTPEKIRSAAHTPQQNFVRWDPTIFNQQDEPAKTPSDNHQSHDNLTINK